MLIRRLRRHLLPQGEKGRAVSTSRFTRSLLIALAAALALASIAGVGATIAWPRYAASLGPIDLLASRDGSTVVVDRDGRVLRPFTLPDGRWRLPATTHDVDPRYIAMLVAYEDGRFYEHHGVDARALLRVRIGEFPVDRRQPARRDVRRLLAPCRLVE